MKKISLILPAYNEESILADNVPQILQCIPMDTYDYEVLVVNDGSSDGTDAVIDTLHQQNPKIKKISFTRNFGKEAAILAGLTQCTGDCAIIMDCDLQHPPTLIPALLENWEKGFRVVGAVKNTRGNETMLQTLFAKGFYFLFKKTAGINIESHSDFKLIDRVVIDQYVSLKEYYRFFRGTIEWFSYPSVSLPFDVAERSGEQGSKWNRLRLFRYAVNNITAFSSAPLKVISYIGVITVAITAFFTVLSLIQKLFGSSVEGFATLNILLMVISSAILLCLGIISHYLARIYEEIKSKPRYVIKKEADDE